MRLNRLRWLWILTILALLAGLGSLPATAGEHRLGGGVLFWRTVDDLDDKGFGDIEDDGLGLVFSYQWDPAGLFRLGLDLEYYNNGFGGSNKAALSPVGFLLLGTGLYGGVGMGVTISDGLTGDASDPFYVARLGFDLPIFVNTRLDFHADYRNNAFAELDQLDTDAITLGATIRFTL